MLICWVFDDLKAQRKLGLTREASIALGILLVPFGAPFLAVAVALLVLCAVWAGLQGLFRLGVGFYDLFAALLRPLTRRLARPTVPKAKVVQR